MTSAWDTIRRWRDEREWGETGRTTFDAAVAEDDYLAPYLAPWDSDALPVWLDIAERATKARRP